MIEKIDVRAIVQKHYRSVRRGTTKPWRDIALFWLPGVAGALVVFWLNPQVAETGSLLAATAILAGFLFALLVLLLEITASAAAATESSTSEPSSRTFARMNLVREMAANVSYAALVSIGSTVVLAIGPFVVRGSGDEARLPRWYLALFVLSLIHLLLTLLMVLKRTFSLLEREADRAVVHPSHD